MQFPFPEPGTIEQLSALERVTTEGNWFEADEARSLASVILILRLAPWQALLLVSRLADPGASPHEILHTR